MYYFEWVQTSKVKSHLLIKKNFNFSLLINIKPYTYSRFYMIKVLQDKSNIQIQKKPHLYNSIKMTLCIWSLIKPLVGSPYSWFKDYWTVVASTCMWDWFLFLEKSVDDLTSNNKEPYLREIKAPTYMTSISTTT